MKSVITNKRHPQYLSQRLKDLRRARAIERAWENYQGSVHKLIDDPGARITHINLN